MTRTNDTPSDSDKAVFFEPPTSAVDKELLFSVTPYSCIRWSFVVSDDSIVKRETRMLAMELTLEIQRARVVTGNAHFGVKVAKERL